MLLAYLKIATITITEKDWLSNNYANYLSDQHSRWELATHVQTNDFLNALIK